MVLLLPSEKKSMPSSTPSADLATLDASLEASWEEEEEEEEEERDKSSAAAGVVVYVWR